jgi:NAD(P)-dependent dehydrogenase (short-subunit alcohol dehydrogenase family)
MKLLKLSVVFMTALAMSLFAGIVSAEDGAKQKAVLVTGASSGIGRNLAERLAAEGHFVYAGARKEADLKELDAIENIKAVKLDVTSQEQIDAAVELIRSEGRGLYGLVNNAGVAVMGTVAETDHSDLHWVFSVNVAGVVSVTRAFLPMILEEQGRISTTGSISGTLSSPGFSVYSMSKHAMEAFTDSLAGEVEPLGVKVSIVEPGNYKSHIRRTVAENVIKAAAAAGEELSAEDKAFMEQMTQRELQMKEPDEVSDAFLHALFSESPLRRYMVVPEEREAAITIKKALAEVVELNEWELYKYDRDELVQMLDEALAAE